MTISSSLNSIPGSPYNRPQKTGANNDTDNQSSNPSEKSSSGKKLTEEEKKQVETLKKRDKEVRTHEQAHMAAGAGVVRGGPQFEYKKGPDGQLYAVGGEVSIDTAEGKTPQETLSKMERIRASALAPANPSGQDLQVAAQASAKLSEARATLAKGNKEEGGEETPGSNPKKSQKPEKGFFIDISA